MSTNPKETTGVSFAEWCPKDKTYECMRGLSGETMVYLINHFLQSDDYIPQVANSCRIIANHCEIKNAPDVMSGRVFLDSDFPN